jgi:hypothetical protein
MPGGPKLTPCPKGEKRDQKTKKCVKRPSPKKRSPKRNTLKKASPKSSNSRRSSSNKSPVVVVPALSKIKPHISDYNYKYLKRLIMELDEGQNWEIIDYGTGEYSYVDSKKIIDIIQKDIDHIKKHHTARNYHFLIESCPILIKELEKYIQYFKRISNKAGKIKGRDISALLK